MGTWVFCGFTGSERVPATCLISTTLDKIVNDRYNYRCKWNFVWSFSFSVLLVRYLDWFECFRGHVSTTWHSRWAYPVRYVIHLCLWPPCSPNGSVGLRRRSLHTSTRGALVSVLLDGDRSQPCQCAENICLSVADDDI